MLTGRSSARNSPEYSETDKSKAIADIDFTKNSDVYFSKLNKIQKHSNKIKQKNLDQEKALMEYLPVNEKFNLNKEGKVLTRWQERQRDWDRIQNSISRKLGSKNDRPLMMTTTDEYRAKIEEYDLIQAALPLKDRYSESGWQMTLRGGGPICIAIGHIFSGIECKVDVNIPKPKMIRKPKPSQATFKNDTFLEQTESLTKKRKKYEKTLTEIRPHTLTYRDAHNLVVRSSNLFTWAKESSVQFFKEQQEDLMLNAIAEVDDGNVSIASENKSVNSVHSAGLDAAIVDATSGPKVDFLSSREIVFDTTLGKDCRRVVSFRNSGVVAMSYRWRLANIDKGDSDKQMQRDSSDSSLSKGQSFGGLLTSKGTDNGLLRSHVLNQRRESFFCLVDHGEVLPDETISTVFTFSSRAGSGVFRSKWILEFTPFDASITMKSPPNLSTTKLVGSLSVMLRGVCIEPDENKINRTNIASYVIARTIDTMALDVIQNCIRRVRDPVRLHNLQCRQIELFKEVNCEILSTLGDTRFTSTLPLFLTPERLQVFAVLHQQSLALFDKIQNLLVSLRLADSGMFTETTENPFSLSQVNAREIRQRLFPEIDIEIFDEVEESQISPTWNYNVDNILIALNELLNTVQTVAEIEERIAARQLLEEMERIRAAKRAARKPDDSDEEEEEEETEEVDEDDDATKVKPRHPLSLETESLIFDVHGALNVLICRPLNSSQLFDITRESVAVMSEHFNDWRSAALSDAGLQDLVKGGVAIPTLPSPFTSREGADAWANALKQTSAIAEPVAPVKGAPKPPKNAPPPTGPTSQQVDYFYKQMYTYVREGILSMTESLFGEMDNSIKEATSVAQAHSELVEVSGSSLCDVATPRVLDTENNVVFISFDGDAFTDCQNISSAFNVAKSNKFAAVQPVSKALEHNAKALVLLYEPDSGVENSDILSKFTEIQELINTRRQEHIVTRTKALRKLKQPPPVFKALTYISCQSFAELNYRLDMLFRYGETAGGISNSSSAHKTEQFFATHIPVILLQSVAIPSVVPLEPPYEEVDSDDDEAPISVGQDEEVARKKRNWIARRPHRVTVDIEAGISIVAMQVYADVTAAAKEAVTIASTQGDVVQWIETVSSKVFLSNGFNNLSPAITEKHVSEGIRDALLWTSTLQILNNSVDYFSSAEDSLLKSNLTRLFPFSALHLTKPTSLAVIGGTIRTDKFRVIDQLIDLVDCVFLVGEVSLPFIALSRHVSMRRHHTMCAKYRSLCIKLLQKARLRGCRLVWPRDIVQGDEEIRTGDRLKCFTKFEPDARNEGSEYEGDVKTIAVLPVEKGNGSDDYTLACEAEAPPLHTPSVIVDGYVYDIGSATCKELKEAIAAADIAFVWGTAGLCELSSFQAGQQALVEAASAKVVEGPLPVVDPSTLTKNPLLSIVVGDSSVEWFSRLLDSDGELGGDLVAAGAVSYAARNSTVFTGVLGRYPSALLSRSEEGGALLRPATEDEWVYGGRVVVLEDEEEEDEEED